MPRRWVSCPALNRPRNGGSSAYFIPIDSNRRGAMLTAMDYFLASTEFQAFVRLTSDFAQLGQWGSDEATEPGRVSFSHAKLFFPLVIAAASASSLGWLSLCSCSARSTTRRPTTPLELRRRSQRTQWVAAKRPKGAPRRREPRAGVSTGTTRTLTEAQAGPRRRPRGGGMTAREKRVHRSWRAKKDTGREVL